MSCALCRLYGTRKCTYSVLVQEQLRKVVFIVRTLRCKELFLQTVDSLFSFFEVLIYLRSVIKMALVVYL